MLPHTLSAVKGSHRLAAHIKKCVYVRVQFSKAKETIREKSRVLLVFTTEGCREFHC